MSESIASPPQEQTAPTEVEEDPIDDEPIEKPNKPSKTAIIEAYNKQHTKSDREFLENWNENLNSLLTFVSTLYLFKTA